MKYAANTQNRELKQRVFTKYKDLSSPNGFNLSKSLAVKCFLALIGEEKMPMIFQSTKEQLTAWDKAITRTSVELWLMTHGRSTQNCAMCGRELTDPNSQRIGIGPVCAERLQDRSFTVGQKPEWQPMEAHANDQ